MLLEFIISLITLAFIVAFVVWLAMLPQKRILTIAVPVCLIGFAVIYAFYLVAYLVPDEPVFGIPAAFSAFVETFGSFTNGVAYSDVAESDRVMEVFSVFWFETLFWALHMLVIICLAITGFAVFGRKFMDRVRFELHMLQYRLQGYSIEKPAPLYAIFGDTEGALLFGKKLSEDEPKAFIVYFSDEYNEELRERIADFRGALIEVNGDSQNRYRDKVKRVALQHVVTFGGVTRPNVNGYSIADLLARKVVKDHAPYKRMFDVPARAYENPLDRIPTHPYAAIVVGFGELGRACLKQLIMASQFTLNGTKPKFYVIDRASVSFDRFLIENPHVDECADIEFLEADVFSFEAAMVIDAAAHDEEAALRHIYVCCSPVQAANPEERTVFHDRNTEIIHYLEGVLGRAGCGDDESLKGMFVTPCVDDTEIWTPEIVLHKELDKRAITLNGWYWDDSHDPNPEDMGRYALDKKRWYGDGEDLTRACDLDMDSSRAAADFMEAYYALVGIDEKEEGGRERYRAAIEDERLLEALARIEHNRWAAFHYCNGFSCMDIETFKERAKQGKSAFKGNDKPHRDMANKLHPCLIPWDELSKLDETYILYDPKKKTKSLQACDMDCPKLVSSFVGE